MITRTTVYNETYSRDKFFIRKYAVIHEKDGKNLKTCAKHANGFLDHNIM